jgi:hypothetical protein
VGHLTTLRPLSVEAVAALIGDTDQLCGGVRSGQVAFDGTNIWVTNGDGSVSRLIP